MWFIIGLCVEVIGWSTIMDAYGVPYICQGVPQCGTAHMFQPVYPLPNDAELCWLEVFPQDSYYDWLWEQPVNVNGADVYTPGLANMTTKPNAPYAYRLEWADRACPVDFRMFGWCTLENVCTAQDKLNGDCTCTAAEQANNECTP
jgi:hypothetical protein